MGYRKTFAFGIPLFIAYAPPFPGRTLGAFDRVSCPGNGGAFEPNLCFGLAEFVNDYGSLKTGFKIVFEEI